MQVWMSNSHGSVAYQHQFFALIRDNLRERRGLRVAERFQSLVTLAELPWLDQPRLLDPSLFTMEIYAAWDELWTMKIRELSARAILPSKVDLESPRNGSTDSAGDELFGRYLAAPLRDLAAFTASTCRSGVVKVSTHRRLIVGPDRRLRDWRVLPGGLSQSTRPSGSQRPS